MQKRGKLLLSALCVVALLVGTVLGTLAYFTDTDADTNVFTVGQVGLKLDEKDVDDSTPDAERDQANKYHLLPGGEYYKDPTVTVTSGSSDAYIYMTVTVKNLESLKAALTDSKYYAGDVFLLQNLCDWQADSPWKYAGFKANGNDGEYRFIYKEKVNGASGDEKLPALFETITVPGDDITSENIGNLAGVEILVNAYAVQAEGFDSYDAAWKVTFGNDAEEFTQQ